MKENKAIRNDIYFINLVDRFTATYYHCVHYSSFLSQCLMKKLEMDFDSENESHRTIIPGNVMDLSHDILTVDTY